MISIQGKVEIAENQARAFEAFTQVRNWPRWWLDCRGAEAPSGWDFGAPLNLVLVPHKMTHRLRARVSGFMEGEMAAFDWSRMGVAGRFTWLFSAPGGGCLVEERLDLKGAGLFIFRGLGQVEALALMVQRNLDGFKAHLEQEG